MRTTLVTACDEGYFVHLQGLIRSIRHKAQGKNIKIYVFDLGLNQEQTQWLQKQQVLTNDINNCLYLPEEHNQNITLKSQVIRAFLPRHIDSEIIIWIDADTWIQDWKAIDLYQQAALKGCLGITPELHRNYRGFFEDAISFAKLSYQEYTKAFGEEIAQKYYLYPILNVGVFSMLRSSPQWKIWQKIILEALKNTTTYVDQITINYGIYKKIISAVEFLPAYCNWGCHQCIPIYDVKLQKFVEPSIPHHVIGIMHLTGAFKNHKQLKIMTTTGN